MPKSPRGTSKSPVAPAAAPTPGPVADPAADQPWNAGFVEIARNTAGRFSSLVTAGGFAAITGSATVFASCYAFTERTAIANDYDVPESFIPYDLHEAILPTIWAVAIGVAVYSALTLIAAAASIVRHFRSSKTGRRDGRLIRFLKWVFAREFNKARPPRIAKHLPSAIIVTALMLVAASALIAGSHYGHQAARSAQTLEVVNDPKWCPPRPAGDHQYCVVFTSASGKVLTRWIDAETGRLGSATARQSGFDAGGVTTSEWFPAVRPPVRDTAR
jgi:hypothetical protein